MAGFILGTGTGVLAAAATYYTLSTHLHRDTDIVREELERANRTIDTSFNPSHPAAPVSNIGPSRNPYEPTFGEQLRIKWNRAVEAGVDGVRETDWTAVGAGVVQGGKDLVGRLNGELPLQTASTPSSALPSRADIRETLDGAKDTLHRGEKAAERAAAGAIDSVQEGATTAGRSVANSSASLLDRLTGAFAGAKSRTDDAVSKAQAQASDVADKAQTEASSLAHKAQSEASSLAQSVKGEARHLSDLTASAAHRAADNVRDAAHEVHDRVSPPPPNAAQRLYDGVKDTLSSAAHKVEDKAEEMKQATEDKVNRMMLEKQAKGAEEYHEGVLKGASGPGVTSANGVDLNKESFTGGSSLGVRARRRAEGTVQGRLV